MGKSGRMCMVIVMEVLGAFMCDDALQCGVITNPSGRALFGITCTEHMSGEKPNNCPTKCGCNVFAHPWLGHALEWVVMLGYIATQFKTSNRGIIFSGVHLSIQHRIILSAPKSL